jgi:hypothetical protein
MAQTDVRATGGTGTICQVTGPYSSTKHPGVVIFVAKGDKFPVGIDGQSATWNITKVSSFSTTPVSEI